MKNNVYIRSKEKRMPQVIVNVPEKKLDFFKELVKGLGFVEKTKPKKRPATSLRHVRKGLLEVEQIRAGKLPKNKIQDLLREL